MRRVFLDTLLIKVGACFPFYLSCTPHQSVMRLSLSSVMRSIHVDPSELDLRSREPVSEERPHINAARRSAIKNTTQELKATIQDMVITWPEGGTPTRPPSCPPTFSFSFSHCSNTARGQKCDMQKNLESAVIFWHAATIIILHARLQAVTSRTRASTTRGISAWR